MHSYPLLDNINSPIDLRKYRKKDLPQICNELRQCLLDKVSQTGGHLASGLGVVEMTVAIHYVFDTPNDNLIWDVGHQSYPHKMLTERRSKMYSMKKLGGISGFPSRHESIFDCFGVGHSSTSISAVLGMAIADKINSIERSNIAVIGDGAMTAGMAFEAIHHAISLSADLLVILNDNEMSISPNVGGLSSYLSNAKFKKNIKNDLGQPNLFENIGFKYNGPRDGHDVLELVDILEKLKYKKGPQLLHIRTIKGKGYTRAEESPIDYHGVSGFDINKGIYLDNKSKLTLTNIFSGWIVNKAENDKNLVAITPAMCEGSGLVEFSKKFPNRYFDVAIAEQHAVTFAAGMSCAGIKPIVAIYSTFLQRAYDQLIHDVALQDLDILFAIDRAGIVGEDGATHSGVFDLAFTKIIPNLIIMTPSNEDEMIKMLNTGYNYSGPSIVRYPKGYNIANKTINYSSDIIPIGKSNIIKKGKKLAILCFGTLLNKVLEVAYNLDITLVDMRFAKPIDFYTIEALSENHTHFLTIEEGSIIGGLGEQIGSFLIHLDKKVYIKCLGIKDNFVEHGTREEILIKYGLDKNALKDMINLFLNKEDLILKCNAP